MFKAGVPRSSRGRLNKFRFPGYNNPGNRPEHPSLTMLAFGASQRSIRVVPRRGKVLAGAAGSAHRTCGPGLRRAAQEFDHYFNDKGLLLKAERTGFKWDAKMAYGVGLLASDGNLSKDGRHIAFVSKDKSAVENFKFCFNLKNRVSVKASGYNKRGKYFYVQFGNVPFYRWLNGIGISANKSKTIGPLQVPKKYFFHFVRGLFDGDGCITSVRHPESRYPQIRMKFASASRKFLVWLKNIIEGQLGVKGRIDMLPRSFELVFYKKDSIWLLKRIYAKPDVFLKRKLLKAGYLLSQEGAGGEIGRHARFRTSWQQCRGGSTPLPPKVLHL